MQILTNHIDFLSDIGTLPGVMRIIIDIRTSSAQDVSVVRFGETWAHFWKKYKPDDDITFLISSHQTHIDGYVCIEALRSFGPFSKKTLYPPKMRDITRCVSFSQFSPYDTTIPTIMHVWSNAETFYPPQDESSWARRIHERSRRRMFHHATTIVVPDIQIGREIVELYDLGEDRIEIVPYLPFSRLHGNPLQAIPLPPTYFLYDGGYGAESGITNLLLAWERYRHDGGTYELVLLGNAGTSLSGLTQTLRSLDIASSVRYLGSLDDGTLNVLYSGAKGWISVGRYYSSGPEIELACAYGLPMLLSDLGALARYPGLHVHAGHVSDIVTALKKLETTKGETPDYHTDESYGEVYEKILMKAH